MQLSDRELNFSFTPDNPRLEDELKLWTRSTRIRYPVTFIAEDFFHGKRKIRTAEARNREKEAVQTSIHFPSLSLSNQEATPLRRNEGIS